MKWEGTWVGTVYMHSEYRVVCLQNESGISINTRDKHGCAIVLC